MQLEGKCEWGEHVRCMGRSFGITPTHGARCHQPQLSPIHAQCINVNDRIDFTLFHRLPCLLPQANSAHQRPGAEQLSVREAYDILSRLYGSGFAGANETLASAIAAARGGFINNPHYLATKAALIHDALAKEQEPKAGDVLVKAFGSCSAGPLHHAFLTGCRHSGKAACSADPKCEWLHDATALPPAPPPVGGSGSSTVGGGEADRRAGVVVRRGEGNVGKEGRPGKQGLRGRGHRMQGGLRGEHCVLALPTVVELLMGWSPFTQAVVKVGQRVWVRVLRRERVPCCVRGESGRALGGPGLSRSHACAGRGLTEHLA